MKPSVADLRDLVATGLCDQAVADICETTRATIAAMRRKHGIPANPWTPERIARRVERIREGCGNRHWEDKSIEKIDESAWDEALAGQSYSDRMAPITIAQRHCGPPPSLENTSTMGWTA